jgi:hypothetical protein
MGKALIELTDAIEASRTIETILQQVGNGRPPRGGDSSMTADQISPQRGGRP